MLKKEKKGLYIHIPFCKYICTYCDFCKKYKSKFDTKKYINNLIKELEKNKGEFSSINTIYIGGGTPSCINIEDLKILFTYINNNIQISNVKEYTIEANPDDISEQLVLFFKENNINRISLGVQTLNNKILQKINREHTFYDVQNAINIIYKHIYNLSLDFMFNLPNQTKEDINQTFEFIEKNKDQIKHISYYSLILEENTILNNESFKNMDPDYESDIYKLIQENLKNLKYFQYEVSSFAQTGYESKHNLKYWERKQYIGVGLGASGFINNIRKTNTKSINNYYKSLKNNDSKSIVFKERLTKEDIFYEKIYLGLRTIKGIDYTLLKNNNIKINENYFNIENDKISIKEEYFFLSNKIILDILEQTSF